ncbi:MAG: ABC transporter permease [Myxococcota bacterium]|nr:ABC transporter permease [Myxococcota bacterium]
MGAFTSLLWLDLRNVWLSLFPLIMLATVFFQGAILRWAVPEKFEHEPTIQLVDNTSDRAFERMISKAPDLAMASTEELQAWAAEDRSRVGLVFSGSRHEPAVEIVHAAEPDAGLLQMARVQAGVFWSRIGGLGWARGHRYTHLGEDRKPSPFNHGLMGVLLAVDVAISAFLFLAMMIFEEKQTGAIEAIKVSPVGTLSYLSAKITATMIHSLPPAVLLILMVMPDAVSSLELWSVLVVATLAFSFAGAILGVLLKSLFDGIFWVVLASYALLLPLFAYLLPTLDQLWMHYIPTWGALYGVRSALFPTGRSDDVWMALFSMLPALALLALIATALVHMRLLRRSS